MSQMHATAVITAVDRASPVFARVAQQAHLAASKYEALAGRMDAITGSLKSAASAFALPAVAAMGALIHRTQEFEKALVGVQVANIADNLKDGVVNFEAIRDAAEQTKKHALVLSAAMSLGPTGFVKAAEAAQKMGLDETRSRKLMELSGAVHIQDRQISQEKATEFLGTVGLQFGAGKDGRNYNDEITRYANQWLAVANMTRTSASRLEEGLRQFAPLYASLGESFGDTASLVGAMTQAGLMDTESGTALKSMANRFLNMTHTGRDAMLVSGLWDRIQQEKLIDMSGTTARQGMLNLKQLFAGRIAKGDENPLRDLLEEGQKGGLYTDAAYQQRLFAHINKITGAKDAPTMESNQEKVLTALLTGGGRIQMARILELMAKMQEEGQLTDAQLGKIGEGRHIARYKALFRMMPEFKKLQGAIKGINSEFTDAGTKLWTESDAGKWEAAVASVDRALVRLRSSGGVRGLIQSLETFAAAIANAPQVLVEFGGKALAASIGIGALGVAMAGVARAAVVIAGSPLLKALLVGGGAAALFASPLFMGADRLDARDLPIETLFGPGAPILQTVERLQTLGAELANTFGATATSVGGLVDAVKSLFGMDASNSLLLGSLQTLNAAIDGLTASVVYWRTVAGAAATGQSLPSIRGYGPARARAADDAVNSGLTSAEPSGIPKLMRDIYRSISDRVTVGGTAEVQVKVTVDGPGTATQPAPLRVPLNVGRSLPDAGYTP